jgi:hypothetical protein
VYKRQNLNIANGGEARYVELANKLLKGTIAVINDELGTDIQSMPMEFSADKLGPAADESTTTETIPEVVTTGTPSKAPSGPIDINVQVQDDFNEVWIRLAALINAATDGVKNRFLGPLGVTTANANIISHLIIQGKTFDELFGPGGYMETNKKSLAVLKEMQAIDYKKPTEKELLKDGKAYNGVPLSINGDFLEGNKLSQLAQAIINRNLPNNTQELLKTRNKWRSMMAGSGVAEFDIFEFLGDTPAERKALELQVAKTNSYNILGIINNLPHLDGYTKLLKFLDDTWSREADAIYPIIRELMWKQTRFVSTGKFKVIESHAFSVAAEQYLVANGTTLGLKDYNGMDLTTPVGRNKFLVKVQEGLYKDLRDNNRENIFVKHLRISEEGLLRVDDLQQLSNSDRAEVFNGFQQLSGAAKKHLFYYSLITNGLSQSKESFAPLFEGDVTLDFDTFVDNKMPNIVRTRMDDIVEVFEERKDPNLNPRSIPFSLGEVVETAEELEVTHREIVKFNKIKSEVEVTYKEVDYIVKGKKIINKDSGAIKFEENSVTRNRIYAKASHASGNSVAVKHAGVNYVINKKGQIMNYDNATFLEVDKNHPTRLAIIQQYNKSVKKPVDNKTAEENNKVCKLK